MDFFDAVKIRRSIRKYTAKPVPSEIVERALDAALLAPNSSNLQTWEFYWVRNPEKKSKLIAACLSQNAARTAQELVVAVAAPELWKKTAPGLMAEFHRTKAPPIVFKYYQRWVPFVYGMWLLAPFKWVMFNAVGLFRPIMRHPWSYRDVQEVAIKSCALACENFMLAVSAQGFDSCPMEGFDETRVKRLLKLSCGSRVVMVISVGERDPKGVWGEQIRLNRDWFVKKID